MTNYRTIPPVGQMDANACWAACLSWWLRAAGGGRPAWSQQQVIVEFTRYTNDDGSFDPLQMMKIWKNDGRLTLALGVFPTSGLRASAFPMGNYPVMVAFNHPMAGTHMNVVFNQVGRRLTAMEPYFPYPGTDFHRTGAFLDRSVDFYIGNSPNIILAGPAGVFTP